LRVESGIDILLAQPGIAKTNIFDKSDLNPTEKPAAQLQVVVARAWSEPPETSPDEAAYGHARYPTLPVLMTPCCMHTVICFMLYVWRHACFRLRW